MRDTDDHRPAPSPGPEGDGTPKFGRLLIVLVLAVLLVVAITIGSEAYFT
ncbi:hypothetical protein [Telluria aromaticivorans]|uniref:Uncharacterized protein n=1 Tax=Telluria aromaticivorans TaxID=2725995 RepID=A0A7Y2JXR1_9BURK|nr:hypothetical protein [Telluria aromaticivorans]NNG22895.1 hypothetical protein [Telluria aromaticivorans]